MASTDESREGLQARFVARSVSGEAADQPLRVAIHHMFTFLQSLGGRKPQQLPAKRIVDGAYCVAASSEKDDDSHCDLVLNDNIDDTWHAGCHAPAWIELDLGQQYKLSHLNLLPYQVPTSCPAHHRVLAGPTRDDLRPVAELQQEMRHHKWIKDVPLQGATARYLKIETLQSEAWVAWSGVQVYGHSSW